MTDDKMVKAKERGISFSRERSAFQFSVTFFYFNQLFCRKGESSFFWINGRFQPY
jgi:hypothetical protein